MAEPDRPLVVDSPAAQGNWGTSGGSVTITSPDGTIQVGGTPAEPTLDVSSSVVSAIANSSPTAISDLAIDDSTLPHQEIPHGVPSNFSWYANPVIGVAAGSQPPSGYDWMNPWIEVYEGVNGNPQPDAEVEFRDMQAYVLSTSEGSWAPLYNDNPELTGASWYEDWHAEGGSITPDTSTEPGSVLVSVGGGFLWHGYPSVSRPAYDQSDAGAVVCMVRARLYPPSVSGGSTPNYVVACGGDFWNSATSGDNDYGPGTGRFKIVTEEWQWFCLFNGAVSDPDLVTAGKTPIPVANDEGAMAAANLAASTAAAVAIADIPAYTARFYLSTNQTVPSSTYTTLSLDTTDHNDNTDMFELTGGQVKVLKTGAYIVTSGIYYSGGSSGDRNYDLIVNGSIARSAGQDGTDPRVTMTNLLRLNAGDQLQFGCWITGGSSATANGGGTNNTGIELAWLGT